MICDNYSIFESLWSNVCMVHCEQWADQSGDFYHKTFAKNALGGNIGLISRTHIFLLWVLLNFTFKLTAGSGKKLCLCKRKDTPVRIWSKMSVSRRARRVGVAALTGEIEWNSEGDRDGMRIGVLHTAQNPTNFLFLLNWIELDYLKNAFPPYNIFQGTLICLQTIALAAIVFGHIYTYLTLRKFFETLCSEVKWGRKQVFPRSGTKNRARGEEESLVGFCTHVAAISENGWTNFDF